MSACEKKIDTTKTTAVAGHVEMMEGSLKSLPLAATQLCSGSSDESQYQVPLQFRGGLPGIIAIDSTDTSPTTTISTVESPMTDSSPSSSPESPTSAAAGPLSLSALTVKPGLSPPRHPQESSLTPPLSPFFGQNAPVSPGRKPRNTKNLSLNMAVPTRAAPPPTLRIKTASAAQSFQSAPPSPSLMMPDRPPKKRPSKLGLSIQTPATGRLPVLDHVNIVPPTPSFARPNTLRHHQSSPSLSVFSPTTGIQGGMQLPPFQIQRAGGPSRTQRSFHSRSHQSSFDSGCTISEEPSPIVSTSLQELEEEDDYSVPLSQEVKSPAYPSGPVCIYDPHVYLYLEPSDQEASQFDVILNVAREVRNPFTDLSNSQQQEKAQLVAGMGDLELTDRQPVDVDTATTTTSTSQLGTEVSKDSDSMVPSASDASSTLSRDPEYIHIPWDHNSNIVDDLLRLVGVIDERVRHGKRVLVHCQCGVSRSASLIVAYGLYKDPSSTVQEVYDAVKKKSRWIGPNMSLIYQLSEFRTKMLKTRGLTTSSNVRSWRGGALPSNTGRANTLPSDRTSASGHSLFTTDDAYESGRSMPQTAPLPDERDRTSTRPDSSSHKETSLEPVNTDRRGDVTPGPLSAPSGLTWGAPDRSTVKKEAVKPPPLTLQEPPDHATGEDGPVVTSDLKDQEDQRTEDVPPTPSLMSPRAFTFTANPLHEPVMKSVFGFHSVDPRSPAQKGEAPIVRSIFDVL
ncbi:MAG: hypothetical protein M1816_000195 [Peltula sp. TS41687]|nr:MAG: hypothetical protein M1816_000195 [Peltula sp. TS41687]